MLLAECRGYTGSDASYSLAIQQRRPSGSGCRTSRIDALPLRRRRISSSWTAEAIGYGAWPGLLCSSRLCGGCSLRFRRWFLQDLSNPRRSQEHAVSGLAFEISLTLYRAIVLTRRLVQHNANPIPGGERGMTEESHSGSPAIVEFDDLANFVGTGHCHLGGSSDCEGDGRRSCIEDAGVTGTRVVDR